MRQVEISIAILDHPDGLVMQRRPSNMGAGGKLGCFGGKLDEGESPLESIVREIIEETTLDLGSSDFTHHGQVEVISDNKGQIVEVLAHVFVAACQGKVEIRDEGELVHLPKHEYSMNRHQLTSATLAALDMLIEHLELG